MMSMQQKKKKNSKSAFNTYLGNVKPVCFTRLFLCAGATCQIILQMKESVSESSVGGTSVCHCVVFSFSLSSNIFLRFWLNRIFTQYFDSFFFSRIKGEKNRIKTKYWVILKRKSNFWLLIHNWDSQQVRTPRKREESQNYTLFSFLSILIFFPPSFFFFKKHQKSEKSLKFQAKTSEFWEKLEDTKNAKKSMHYNFDRKKM